MPTKDSRVKSAQYVEHAIVQLLALKMRAGYSASEMSAFVAGCLESAKTATAGSQTYQGLDIHRLGSILRCWHTETGYLTFDGLPRPLRIDGRFGLKGLVRRF